MTKFDDLNPTQLAVVLKTGSLATLPVEYQEYYSLMEKVRGLRAKGTFNDKIITKAGIIKLLKNTHELSDLEARRLYDDAINFFYAQDNVRPEAFANLYADKLEDAAQLAFNTNQLEVFDRLMNSAAKLRGCFVTKAPEIPKEMFIKQNVIYTTSPEDVGLIPEDKKEVERLLDALPDIPAIKMQRVKADAGVKGYKYSVMRNMAEDIEDFVDEETKKD